MSALHLLQLPVILRPFIEWALARGYLATPPGDGRGKPRDADPGYALHALLAGLLGQEAPRPFCPPPLGQKETRARAKHAQTDRLELWGYARRPAEDLRELAKLAEDDRLTTMVDWPVVRSKPMPDRWPEGLRLRFDLRACPVKRLMQPLTLHEGMRGRETTLARGAEVDAYQIASVRREAGAAVPDRLTVYRDWLSDRFPAGTATPMPQSVRVLSFRSTRLLRRPYGNGRRTPHWLTRPDVRFSGLLEIVDNEEFASLLATGIGRHCGFGFGMLLLRPA